MDSIFQAADFENLKKCPWCGSRGYRPWGKKIRGFQAATCKDCDLIFIRNRFSQGGLNKYYKHYMTDVHETNILLNRQRKVMYNLEFKLIYPFLKKRARILDVGCSGGYFLDLFKKAGFQCFGVEFGEEAAKKAQRKHYIWRGEMPKLKIPLRFDLVIFRGVIEHVPFPKEYLKKAVSLLKPKGMIFITSTPNADSVCCRLFQEKWNQHHPEPHLMHFKPEHFDSFFRRSDFEKLKEHFFYLETPYANPEQDILKVAKAIRLRQQHKNIPFVSPAFWGNMLSLVYRKKVGFHERKQK